jgi:hypothetical protein
LDSDSYAVTIGKFELNKVPKEFDLNQGLDGGRCGLKPNVLLQLSATKAPQKSKKKRLVME